MNKNFHNVFSTETQISSSINNLIEKLSTFDKQAFPTHQRLLASEIKEHFLKIQHLYFAKLQSLISEITTPEKIFLIQKLATSNHFCSFLKCYKNSSFHMDRVFFMLKPKNTEWTCRESFSFMHNPKEYASKTSERYILCDC